MHRSTISIVIASLALALAAPAQEASPVEAALKKMRESLRSTMLQLQTAQAESAALKVAQAELEEKNKKLAAEIESEKKKAQQAAKEASADRLESEKTIIELNSQVAAKTKDVAAQKDVLAKWKDAYGKAVVIARDKENERAKITSKFIEAERKLADRERRNAELFKVGNEILDRYKKFSLGHALAAREPFTGITRVKLENLAQDYDNKLRDQKWKPSDDEKSQDEPPSAEPTKAEKAAAAQTQEPASSKPAAPKTKS